MRKETEKEAPKQNRKEKSQYSSTSSAENEVKIGASEIEDEIQLERREAYIEPLTRDFLRRLIRAEEKNTNLAPVYIPGMGFVYQLNGYNTQDGYPAKISREFLENLARLDILEKNFFDSVSTCPSCQSTAMTIHGRCPNCKSHHIKKTSLTEHIPCGNIDQRDKYIQNRCPRCNQPLIEGQIRDMGRWYTCQECNERFEHPEYDIICRNCQNKFTIEQAKVVEISKYSLSDKRKKEIQQNVVSIESIGQILTSIGFTITTPGIAIGQKSGMQHHFSMLAKKEDQGQEWTVAVDHAVAESEVQASPLILYLYKTSEVSVDLPIFVAIPKLSENAKKIAQGHKILLIEGYQEEIGQIIETKKAIESRLNQLASEPPIAFSSPGEHENNEKRKITIPKEPKMKPQLFETMTTIHPQTENNTKKTAILSKLKRTVKNTVEDFKKTNEEE